MTNKTMTQGKTETDGAVATETPKQFVNYDKKPLNKVWGKKQVCISLKQAKAIVQAFADEKLSEKDLLFFEDEGFFKYRKVGQQNTYQMCGVYESNHKALLDKANADEVAK